MGKRKRKMGTKQQSRANDICAHYREKGHWKRDYPKLPPKQDMFLIEVSMVTNFASWELEDTSCSAHIRNDLQLDNDPKTYREAMSDIDSGKWLEAMKSKNGLHELEPSLDACGKMIYLVTWVDFEETFSPAAMAKSILIMLAIAACKLPEAGTYVFMKSYGAMILSRTTLTLMYTRRQHSVCCQCTRPDVAYAVSVKSRYQASTREAYWTAVKTILKYPRRTKDKFLVYDGGELILKGSSDASFQSDDDDAKSQLGLYSSLMVVW
ncbi:UNVERIFIED_CONTAM: Retrovirus-related Pol polyprotein from transposon TNT 1-94 [Sesamum calycinum]|uniref:Retrovirus-related Pol polyprotein from transposon TNT 1-94 n=1 Tax=Sesamum calycinum TaxID=2727403 RepID=A0AAW2R6W5_9LAMI